MSDVGCSMLDVGCSMSDVRTPKTLLTLKFFNHRGTENTKNHKENKEIK